MSGFFVAGGVYRRDVVFSLRDADGRGEVGACAVVREFQEIAGCHYGALGFGRKEALAHGCFWALARTEVRAEAPVPPEVPLWLDCWAGKQAHGLFWMHYRLSARTGGVLLRGVSIWLLMDPATRAMTRERGWITDLGGTTQPGELEATLRRPFLPAELPRERVRTVGAGETDRNDHLNNARYLCWAQELLPGDFAGSRRLRSLWVEYKKELLRGQKAKLRYHIDGGTLFLRARTGDKESFILRADYDPI